MKIKRRAIKADTLADGRQVSEGSLRLDVIENKLQDMIGKPVSQAANFLAKYGFDNTELNGQDGYRKTSGIDSYDTWAGYENNEGYYVKLYYTMERDHKHGNGNRFTWGILTDFHVDKYDVTASTKTKKQFKVTASDDFPVSDEMFTLLTEQFEDYINNLKAYYTHVSGEGNDEWKVTGYFVPEKSAKTGEIRNIWFAIEYDFKKPSGGYKPMILVEANYDPAKSDMLQVYVTCPALNKKDEFIFKAEDFEDTNFDGMDIVHISPLQEEISGMAYNGELEDYFMASTRATKRPIRASEFGSLSLSHAHDYDEKYSAPAKRVEMTFPYFLQDIEDFVKEDSYDFSVNGTTLYDSDDYIELEVIPTYAGSQLDTERVVIRFDANESPSFVAEYDNGYQFASGDSFSSILVEVTQSIRESLVEYMNNYDENYEEE